MPAFDDDDRPKKKIVHDIGQELTLLSVAELTDRIDLMKEEIARLEADIAKETGVALGRRHILQKIADICARCFRRLDRLLGNPRGLPARAHFPAWIFEAFSRIAGCVAAYAFVLNSCWSRSPAR